MKLSGKYLIGVDMGSGDSVSMYVVPVSNGRLRFELAKTVHREEFDEAMDKAIKAQREKRQAADAADDKRRRDTL